jgi:O-antigen ligase
VVVIRRDLPIIGIVLMTAAASAAGAAIVEGGYLLAAACCAVPLLMLAAPRASSAFVRSISFAGSASVGTAWILLILSTFVWRVRTTDALVSNPLDKAAMVRVALVAIAGVLVLIHLLRHPTRAALPVAVVLLIPYAGTAIVSAVGSPLPLFGLYRAFELSVGLGAIVAVATADRAEWRKALDLILAAFGAICLLAWLEAITMPTRGWEVVHGVVSHALIGYFPAFSSNSLGAYGAVLAVWGIAQLDSPHYRPWVVRLAAFGGLLTLLATQYRTGIVAFLLGLAYVAWQRRRGLFAFVVLGGALVVISSGDWSAIRTRTQVVFARGNADAVSSLDSRSIYWHAAEPYIKARPVFGWGLNVGTRKVLNTLGLEETSTIHSTWFEALLGTGIIGALFLACAYLALLAAALSRERDREKAAIVGIAIIVLVRSFTGTTVELFDVMGLLFGALALATRAPPLPER